MRLQADVLSTLGGLREMAVRKMGHKLCVFPGVAAVVIVVASVAAVDRSTRVTAEVDDAATLPRCRAVVAEQAAPHCGLHQHVPLRVQSVPVVGGVNVLVDTAM